MEGGVILRTLRLKPRWTTYVGITSAFSVSCSTGCRHGRTILDPWGRLSTQTLVSDPEGATSADNVYDTSGRVQSISHPHRSTTASTDGLETPAYDGLDRVIKITHPDNLYSQTFYGSRVSGAGLGGVTSQLCSTSYGLGFPVLFIDEAGKKRESWTDGFGRIIELDEPDSSGNLTQNTCYAYDLLNNLTQVVHGTQTRTYAYDPLSRATASTTPESGTTNFYYTTSAGGLCSGNPSAVCRRTDARSITTTSAYDALNRPISVAYSDGTPTAQYGYDANALTGCATAPPTLSMTNPKGRRTAMCDGSGAAAWSYDAAGRVSAEARTIAGITKTISYAHNLDGSISTVTYPSGRQVAYTVSDAQRLTSAKDVASGTQYAIQASYAPPGPLRSLIFGQVGGTGGITESRSYNNRLQYTATQATSSAGTALNLSLGYSLPGGNNGTIASITNNVDNGRTLSFQYDPLNRISSAATQATSGVDCWGQSFTPDALANLNSIGLTQCSGYPLSVTVDGNNHINSSTAYAYDAAGNMTLDGSGLTYSFDAENRILQASGMSGGPYCYAYDGNGLRVAKKSNATTCAQGTVATIYWRGISGAAIAESDSAGNITNEYVFFVGRRIARLDSGGNVFYLFADHLGTTRAITLGNGPNTGAVCYDAEFTPYGQEMSHTERLQTTACPQNYKFTGYERDPETGLDYAFARYYSYRLGRFLSVDPVGGSTFDPQSFNRYAYTVNNPTNSIDPLGLKNVPGGARWYINGGGGGGSCTADGLDIPCFLAYAWLQSNQAVQCPNNICRGVNWDNLPVQFTATTDGSYYSCLLSGAWSSREAAGIAAVNCANGPSIATNTEYSGNVYQIDSNGEYSFTLPGAGTPDSSTFDPTDIPDATEYAGSYHTHAAFDLKYDNEQFSEEGCNGGQPCDIGLALHFNQGQPMFLGTPAGRVEVFYPDQFNMFPFGCVLVGSAVPAAPGTGTSSFPVPVCH
ncbi:MAG: hypothetical protein DMG32_16195 [Acidobacteria bacterium]|nr:MAG: hypothetical protein DMG32_16195 [Acidobacteriota bacterium]